MIPPDPARPPEIPDYAVLKRIGRGSYGEVWLARGVTGVFRVIKIVRRDRFDHDRPFLRELEGITRYQQTASGRPRQLALLHVGINEAEGYFYYVMEPADDAETGSAIHPDRYVPLTLKELLHRRGRLPLREAVQIALELARGLAVLHAEKLIHRDIKPSNVIFTQGVPKLADVGLVALSDASMTHVGTPGYLPPEGPGTPAGDIYSLGKVIYELATGFDRNSYPKLPDDYAAGSPDALLLREINAVVLRACHPQPHERQASAEAIARDLELVQAGRSVAFYEGLRKRLHLIAWAAAAFGVASVSIALLLVWRADVQARAREQSRKAYYRSDMAVAQLAKASGDLGRARAALQRQIPAPGETDLRGIEWSILAHEVQGEGTPLPPYTNGFAIRKLAADPTGRWLAASYANDHVALWDLRTQSLATNYSSVRVLGGFRNSDQLITDTPDRELTLHTLSNGHSTSLQTRRRLQQLLPDARTVLVSPSGDLILYLHNPRTGVDEKSLNASKLWPDFEVSAQCVSSDGNTIALALYRELGAIRQRFLVVVDFGTGHELWKRDLPKNVPWLASTKDKDKFILNTGGLTISLHSFEQPAPLLEIHGHTARVHDAAMSNGGHFLATASADQSVKVWSTTSGTLDRTLWGLGRPATSVTWSTSDDVVFAGDDNGLVQGFNLQTSISSNLVSGLYGDVHGDLIFNDRGSSLIVTSSTNSIRIFSSPSLVESGTISNVFQPIRLGRNGESLVGLTADWSLVSLSLLDTNSVVIANQIIPSDFSVRSWALSSDRTAITFTGRGGRLIVANTINGETISGVDPATNTMFAVTFSGNGTEILTGGMDGGIRRWSRTSAAVIGSYGTANGDIQCITTSSDGRWLAVGLFSDSTLRILDLQRRRWLAPRLAHRRFIVALTFTKNCDRLISAGADGRVIMWRVPEFEEISAFEVEPREGSTGDEGISMLSLAPDESALAALTEDGRLRLWNASKSN